MLVGVRLREPEQIILNHELISISSDFRECQYPDILTNFSFIFSGKTNV